MPKVNHDADISRLVEKYGVPARGGKQWQLRDNKYINTRRSKKHGKVEYKASSKTWLEIQKEYLKWRKTPEFAKWKNKQFLKQGGTCYYCDLPLYGGTRENVEHVIPKILGGDNRHSNLVLACAKCNKDKYTNLLSLKERELLKAKNRQKRGTYIETRQLYKTESDVASELRDMFRE